MGTLKGNSDAAGMIAGLVGAFVGIPATLAAIGAASSDIDFFESSLACGILLGGSESVGLTSAPLESSSEPAAEFGPFWQDSSGDWHFGDDMPYSAVEQKARQVYDMINSEKYSEPSFPAVIAESPEAYAALTSLFDGNSSEELIQTVEVLEEALKNGQAK